MTTPRARIGAELERLVTQRRLPHWASGLAHGNNQISASAGRALHSYHNALLQRGWPSIREYIEADRAKRISAFTSGGLEGLLRSYNPLLRWNPPYLEADCPVTQELVLDGRGLLLQPAYFCHRTPVPLTDPELQPVLLYPVPRDVYDRVLNSTDESLSALIGRTRAVILRSIEEGCTTTELSRRAGTSIASASQHTAILRSAGLVITQRNGNSVLHSLTKLGFDLLSRMSTKTHDHLIQP